MLGFVLIYAGIVPLNEAQKAYFANLSIFDYASTMVLGVTNIAAAVLLFRLRRTAVPLFASALILNLALTTRAVLGSKWTQAIGANGLVGASLGLLTILAVLLYAMRLRQREILQ